MLRCETLELVFLEHLLVDLFLHDELPSLSWFTVSDIKRPVFERMSMCHLLGQLSRLSFVEADKGKVAIKRLLYHLDTCNIAELLEVLFEFIFRGSRIQVLNDQI